MKHAIAIAAVLALTGCGGQAKPLNICLQPSDHTVAMKNCDSTIQPLTDADPVNFVYRQMLNPGNVMLWIGREQSWAVANYQTVINEAKKYGDKVTYVYVKDEMNLCAWGPCLGRDDALVSEATHIAHAAGFKTLATITPSVIFARGFKLPDVDAISVDAYWATFDTGLDMGGCNMSKNPLLNVRLCTFAKLRSMGHQGLIGDVFQGFGLDTDTHDYRVWYLTMQLEAVQNSGADAYMAWGCQPDGYIQSTEPRLKPLCGTTYESLVTP